MPLHTGVSSLGTLTVSLALLAPTGVFADDTRDNFKQAVTRDLPRYDPAAYEKAQAEKAARAAPKNAPAPLPEAKPAAPTATTTTASEHTLALPTVTVHPDTEPPKHLPRIEQHRQLHDTPAEQFESPAGRDARLVRNHLSPLAQALHKIFGISAVAAARQMEAEKEKARQMNELATGIEIQEALGRDPADIKKLRAEYTKLYYSGPK